MPPKGKKGGGKDSKSGEEKREEPLQAVIFADSFETRFNPFTLERPRCLLPLANTPLLEYTCEFLAGAGVEEVYLYCGNFTDQVEEYLRGSKWTRDTAPFALEIIRSSSRSIGDCMRDLHQKELIVGDFICVYGDVVANISLEAALAQHRARVEKDKKSIMTMVLREADKDRRSRQAAAQSVRPVFVIDPHLQRCVHYEQVPPGRAGAIELPSEVLKDHVELDVREDLIDCGIDICTPEVLAQYTDNFDWQMPRRGFLYGVLKDFETFQLTIHTHVATDGYAARVKSLQDYDAISKDVVSRWAYPLCPDTNLVADQTFQLGKRNVYKEDNVVLARSCVVSRNSVLGKASSVGDNTTITDSVIGRRCVIGKRVRLNGAYIWDDAQIGDDTVIDTAIVANDAYIGKGCKIESGALISNKVRIADKVIVPGDKRITTLKRKRGYESDDVVKATADPKVVGEGGEGHHLEADEDEEDLLDGLVGRARNLDLDADEDAISNFDSEDEENDFDSHAAQRANRSDSFASVGSEESGEARNRASDFHHEAVNSIFDALQKKEDPDTMQLELRALTLSSNAEGKQVRRAIAVAYAKRIANLAEEESLSPKEAAAQVIGPNQLLIKANVKEEDEQAEFMLFLQTDLVHRKAGEKILLFASNELATKDLIEAEGFEAWWNDPRSSATDELERVRKETKQLVDVLVGDDDDDDDDDGDEDESDEEED